MKDRHAMFGGEVNWTRVGLGVEFAIGHWWPREWSMYLHLGPVLVWGGWEECDDFCAAHGHTFQAPQRPPE